MDDIDRAGRVSTYRAHLFYLGAVLTTLDLMTTANAEDIARLLPWLAMIILGAVNLSTVGLVRSARLKSLLDDETTRGHRGMAMVCGFWASLLSGLAVGSVSRFLPLSATFGARVIVTATLVAALVAFATLELRAARE